MIRFRTLAAAVGTTALLAALPVTAVQAAPADTAYALSDGTLLSFDPYHAQDPLTSPINGVAAGEQLVSLAARPVNGVLYGLGVDAAHDTATLYVVGGEEGGVPGWPATAVPVGPVGSIAFTSDGVTPVDLPATGWAISFSPTVDRLRATTTSGLNFRVNPNTGVPIDGGAGTGTNPDGPLNGASTTVGGLAYTDAHIGATTTTAYTLDAANDELALLNPANNGTLTNPVPLTQDGLPFAAGAVSGFAIDPGVTVPASNVPATSGKGYAALKLGTTTKLYEISLATGAVSAGETIGDGSRAIQAIVFPAAAEFTGFPVVGLESGSDTLRRFATNSSAVQQTSAVTGLAAGEHLAGVAWRTQTGQLIGVGINAAADTGTVYRIDPQNGAATAIGAPGSLRWVTTGGATVDLPASGWSLDVAPFYDTVRIVNGPAGGLNLRARLTDGQPIDGDANAAGVNPDHALTGGPAGGTGVTTWTYAYPWPEPTTNGGLDVAFGFDPGNDNVMVSVGTDYGQLSTPYPLTLAGAPLDFSAAAADIPWGTRHWAVAALTVGGTPGLYRTDVDSGVTDVLGTLPVALSAVAAGSAVPSYAWKHATVDNPRDTRDDRPGTSTTTTATTPPPSVVARPTVTTDRTRPTIKNLKISAKAKRRLTVSFTASEAGKATIKLTRTVKHGRKTVRKTYKSVSKTITKAGKVTVTFKGLTAGRLRVEITMKDKAGNATAKAARKSATVRSR